ncbi:MAG: hypothetical protein JWM05_3323 [Acidimicrobiales bacterium]|nr:hypothetical protein [Acidimicrobiales bacterium]
MKVSSHGIETDLPPGWEGRISLRRAPDGHDRALGSAGEVPNPVVHLANFPLPEQRGDFGSGAVDVMGSGDVLVVLFEYGPESVGQALFDRQGIPTALRPAMFSGSALQRTLPSQAGCQVFFTTAGRAFCCYVVLGRHDEAARLVPKANTTLRATRIGPR